MRSASLLLVIGLAATPLGVSAAQPAPLSIGLPHPPPITNQTSSTLFDALLAVSRAQQTNPQAAQTAAFQYTKAVQLYRSGDINGARASALGALATAAQLQTPTAAPLPVNALAPVPAQLPGTQGGLYGADAPAIDADSFLALARGTIDDCAARRAGTLAAAQRHYARAASQFALHNWEGTRVEAKLAIDACAKARK